MSVPDADRGYYLERYGRASAAGWRAVRVVVLAFIIVCVSASLLPWEPSNALNHDAATNGRRDCPQWRPEPCLDTYRGAE